INNGLNPGDMVQVSGTVGATLTGARLGIPGIAVSQETGAAMRYDAAADYAARLVETYRTSATFRRIMRSSSDVGSAHVVNVNFPTCTTGSVRGVRAVILGRQTRVVAYAPLPGGALSPTVLRVPLGSTDCTSKLENPATDLEALNNGFASVTLL